MSLGDSSNGRPISLSTETPSPVPRRDRPAQPPVPERLTPSQLAQQLGALPHAIPVWPPQMPAPAVPTPAFPTAPEPAAAGGPLDLDGAAADQVVAPEEDVWHLEGRRGPLTGHRLGEFEVGTLIGAGGMGEVYRAMQVGLGRRVALKCLPDSAMGDAEAVERFMLEARAASRIRNEHVIEIYASGHADGHRYFAMEVVNGSSLGDLITLCIESKQPLPMPLALDVARQVAVGLCAVADAGIVHRDIKPDNLLMNSAGRIKIADFGLVKTGTQLHLTQTGTTLGTPTYLSPEQARGEAVDCRTDIYSLGVVLYELLTLQPPFSGETADALLYQHNYAEPPLPRSLNPAIPPAYEQIILTCLQKEASRRYATPAKLIEAIDAVLARREPLGATLYLNTGADERLRRLDRRGILVRRAVMTVCLVVIAVLLVVLAILRKPILDNELKARLQALDLARPIPSGIRLDLQQAAALKLADAQSLARWSDKVDHAERYSHALDAFDAQKPITAGEAHDISAILDPYATLVGPSDVRVAAWRDRLSHRLAVIDQARADLAGLDSNQPLSDDELASLSVTLSGLTVLSGMSPDTLRWETDLATRHAQLDECRARLRQAMLAPADHHTLAIIGSAAAELARLAGADDADVVAARRRWAESEARIQALRRAIAAHVAGGVTTLTDQDLAAAQLSELQGLVGPDDAELRVGQEWRDTCQVRIVTMRERLATAMRQGLLSAEDHQQTQQLVTLLGAVVGSTDPDVMRGADFLLHDDRELQAALATLRRLDDPAPIRAVDVQTLSELYARLAARSRIPPVQALAWHQRLSLENDRLSGLKGRWQVLDRAAPLPPGVKAGLDGLAQDLGADDPDVVRWRAKVARVQELESALAVLNECRLPPQACAAQLDELTTLIGDQGPVHAWRLTLERITALMRVVRVLDLAAPVPDHAAEAIDQLVVLVGAGELPLTRWRAKLARVAQLRGGLEGLMQAYLPGPHSADDIQELAQLVGAGDAQVRASAQRLAQLLGPGAPAWSVAFGRDAFGSWADAALGDTTVRLRYLPPGTFLMGSPADEAGRDPDEHQFRCTLTRGFWLGETLLTQAQLAALGDGGDCRFAGAQLPAESRSWNEVRALLAAHNAHQAPTLRLPTEAEWEYAARVGGEGPTPVFYGADGVGLPDALARGCWDASTSGMRTHPVKLLLPNRLGLYDMLGNVWELCQDAYLPYPTQPTTDPAPDQGRKRTARGGSWGDADAKCRSANRLEIAPDLRSQFLGLRLAADADVP